MREKSRDRQVHFCERKFSGTSRLCRGKDWILSVYYPSIICWLIV